MSDQLRKQYLNHKKKSEKALCEYVINQINTRIGKIMNADVKRGYVHVSFSNLSYDKCNYSFIPTTHEGFTITPENFLGQCFAKISWT